MTYIDRSSIYLHGESAAEARDNYATHESAVLAEVIVNDRLNSFIGECNNIAGDKESDDNAVPYMGWWWRGVDFFNPHGITIARGDGQVAVCQNNKWGYPSRSLTEDEQAEFRSLVWSAWVEYRKGGVLSEIHAKTRDALDKAGEFIANLGGPFDD